MTFNATALAALGATPVALSLYVDVRYILGFGFRVSDFPLRYILGFGGAGACSCMHACDSKGSGSTQQLRGWPPSVEGAGRTIMAHAK